MPKPSPPPPPPPSDGTDRPGDSKIYAFLVGINDYLNLSDLRGCVKDIEEVEAYLKWRYHVEEPEKETLVTSGDHLLQTTYDLEHFEGYESLNIFKLWDQGATYDNVITHFQNFLRDAGANDKVWFHFSGHGAEATTAEVFARLENGKDQCFLCHDYVNDSGTLRNLLADKEIARLLSVIAEGENGLPHILVTLDTCHSGSGTREGILGEEGEDLVRSVELPRRHDARSLDSYFGYAEGDEYVGPPPHINITACNNLQLAGDTLQGGVFTLSLLEELDAADGHINYADLNTRTRHNVRLKPKKHEQTPQFDVIGGLGAYSLFLDGRPDGDPDRYEVTIEGGVDVIKCGAIHHLPQTLDPSNPIMVKVFAFANNEEVAQAMITGVGPHMSSLVFQGGSRLTNFGTGPFYGIINHMPAPAEFVWLNVPEADESMAQAVVEAWSDKERSKNIQVIRNNEGGESPLMEVTVENGRYVLHDLGLGHRAINHYDNTINNRGHLLQDIRSIVDWHRTVELTKDRTPLLNQANVELDEGRRLMDKIQLHVNVKGRNKSWGIARDEELTIEASAENDLQDQRRPFFPGDRPYNYNLNVVVNREDHDTQKLYFYLLYLDQDYTIDIVSGEKIIPEGVPSAVVDYKDNELNVIGIAQGNDEFTYYFKLLVTTSELDYHQLLQTFGDRFGRRQSQDPQKGFGDWCAITKKVKIVRAD